MGNLFKKQHEHKPMKLLAVLLLTSLVAFSYQTTYCAATSYCQDCNTTSGACTGCPSKASGSLGAYYLATGGTTCTAVPSTWNVPVGSGDVDYYSVTAANSFTTSSSFTCKSGKYGLYNSANGAATNLGCYSSSSNAVFTSVGTAITNCDVHTSNNGAAWECRLCKEGYRSTTSTYYGNCNGTISISNCRYASYDGTSTETCVYCKDNYTLNSSGTGCIAQTTALANCYEADTAGTACATCNFNSYFNGSAVCVASAKFI